jgi:hypothetical protein
VRAGVVVRMAVLYELLAGARRPGGDDPPDSADAAGRPSAEAQLA